MAENKDGSLLGYDPLAWMLEEAEPQPQPNLTPVEKFPGSTADSAIAAKSLIAPSEAGSAPDDILPGQTDALVVSFENSAMLLPEMNDLAAVAEITPALATESEQQAVHAEILPQNTTPNVMESVIKLDSVLNIQNVAGLHARLLKALDNNSSISLDASAVNVADTASLQLLLILKRTAIKLQKEVAIDFPSDRFIEAAELLGISEMLEVDQAAAGLF